MRVHLEKEIHRLQRQILALGAEVENDVRAAVRAVEASDQLIADSVVMREAGINAMEVDVEEECLKILALHQPVAGDLRYIIAVLKINQDLERIGDLAVHIAERALFLFRLQPIAIPGKMGDMADKTQAMLKSVLDAFVNSNPDAARRVCALDNEVDELHRSICEDIKVSIQAHPLLFEPLLQVMHISRHLERIADHVTNIAEDLIYMVEGRIVRHTAEVSSRDASTDPVN